ncbi:hypothetical protein M378DRAFT_437935 [Amanita muscaria Koide BX008]|uniref:Uncharacterized protein n=1 Tax=Amanita muscaria (strain Koide BX008) TaxID=946122 RepID=A0A0C2WJF5_AMAMK|nr:hypothetical protein M378DRAFT_437935 [Amanita muscaria Koide BX008]
MVVIERMSSLLAFDYAETVARVRSVVEAQKLIDIIDLLIHNQTFLSHCGGDAACKAALLASEIYSRVPLLPRSVFFSGPTQQLLKMKELPQNPFLSFFKRVFEKRFETTGFESVEASLCIHSSSFNLVHVEDSLRARARSSAEFWRIIMLFAYGTNGISSTSTMTSKMNLSMNG